MIYVRLMLFLVLIRVVYKYLINQEVVIMSYDRKKFIDFFLSFFLLNFVADSQNSANEDVTQTVDTTATVNALFRSSRMSLNTVILIQLGKMI